MKKILGRPRHRWTDNNTLDLKEIGVNMRNYLYKTKTWNDEVIKNVERREECETYLTQGCRHHWSGGSPVKR